MTGFKLFACLLILAVVSASDFENYRLVRISPKSVEHKELVESWSNNLDLDFDVWNEKSDFIDVLMSPKSFVAYSHEMEQNKIEYSIINNNVQETLNEEKESIQKLRLQKFLKADSSIVGTYATHDKINSWIAELTSDNLYVTYYSAGKTYEGRDLRVIKIKTPTAQKAIWLDCGIHAREWISPATCVYMINSFINDYNQGDSSVKKILDYYEIHVLPVVNPDGYDYTFSSSANRLWRKNRNKFSGTTCIGVDLNRNFGYQWMVAGASNNPCQDTYAGPTPDSELETQAIEKAIMDLQGKWDAYISFHTYGQMWFTVWGYTSALTPDYNEMVKKCQLGTNALKAVYGSTFTIGSPTNLLYAAAGGSIDWTRAIAGIKYSHALELRPGQSGTDSQYGFSLPVDRAVKAGEETYRGILAFIASIQP